MIKAISAQGTAKNEAEASKAVSFSDAGGECFGQSGMAVTFAVNGPAGYRPPVVAVTRTESPGRITGSCGGVIDELPPRPVTLRTVAALIRTLPVLATE